MRNERHGNIENWRRVKNWKCCIWKRKQSNDVLRNCIEKRHDSWVVVYKMQCIFEWSFQLHFCCQTKANHYQLTIFVIVTACAPNLLRVSVSVCQSVAESISIYRTIKKYLQTYFTKVCILFRKKNSLHDQKIDLILLCNHHHLHSKQIFNQ